MSPNSTPLVKPLVYAADDSADYRFLLQRVFKLFLPDYTLHLFEDGQALTKALDMAEKPGLLLIDIQMPILNGCQAVKMIRQHEQWRYVPVVIMSNTDQANEVADCYMAGANSFLVKPTDVDSMRQVMQSLCFYWFELNKQALEFSPLPAQG